MARATGIGVGGTSALIIVSFLFRVWAAGGLPAEFGRPDVCGGMSQGMRYILPRRDFIAVSVGMIWLYRDDWTK